MNTHSKIDVRIEAMRMALQLKCTTVDNAIKTAKKIEAYILSDADLPEVGMDYFKVMTDKLVSDLSKMDDDVKVGVKTLVQNEGKLQ